MIAGAQYTIVDLSDPIQQGTAPANPVTGMLWLDTSASPPMLRRWNGTSWEDVGDSGAGAEALEEINKLKSKKQRAFFAADKVLPFRFCHKTSFLFCIMGRVRHPSPAERPCPHFRRV